MSGKSIRLERIIDRETGRAFILPLDHGATMGPLPGLYSIKDTVAKAAAGGATAVLMHKGMVDAGHRGFGRDVGLILHLSAGSIYSASPDRKVIVSSVEEALRLGADAVSVHLNIGGEGEPQMLEAAGKIAADCAGWGVPLLAMVYPKGKAAEDPDAAKTCVRTAAELGADLVKISYTGDPDSFREVTRGCPVPVVIAGGPDISSDRDLLTMVYDALDAEGAGISIGRRIFEHPDITGICSALSDIVFRKKSVDEAMRRLSP